MNIGIPPIKAPTLLTKNYAATKTHARWLMRIKTSTGKLADNYNYIGASAQANDEYDPMDMVDAPVIRVILFSCPSHIRNGLLIRMITNWISEKTMNKGMYGI